MAESAQRGPWDEYRTPAPQQEAVARGPWDEYRTPALKQEAVARGPWDEYRTPALKQEAVARGPWEEYARVEAAPQATTANPFKGAAARTSELAASGLEGIARVAEGSRDYLDDKLSYSGLSKEEIKGKQQLKPMFEWVDSLRSWGKEINYAPSTKLSDLKENPLNAVPFITERIISSSPDMAAAFYAFPVYIGARTNEILNDRLKNDEKKLENATVADVATAFGAAVLEASLEKFATKSVLKGTGITGKTKASRIGKETAFQSGTEGVEEAIGYLGGAAGTKKGVDTQQLMENVLEGAIVGGGLGTTAQGVKEYVNAKETKAKAKEAEQVKTDLARLDELEAKSKGTPDKIVVDKETGERTIEKGAFGEGFTPEEQQEYQTLNATYSPKTETEAGTEATTEPKSKELIDLTARFEAQGMAREEAENLAKEELAKEEPVKEELGETDVTDQLKTGTDQSGVPVLNEPSQTVGGVTTTQPGALAGVSEITGVPPDGTTTQQDTLVPPPVASTTPTAPTITEEASQQQGAIDATETTEAKPIEEAAKEEPAATDVVEGQPAAEVTEEPVLKGKRGRPKKVLTPEEQAAKDTTRKQQQNEGKQSILDVEDVEKKLAHYDDVHNNPEQFINQFKNDEEAEAALIVVKDSRQKALIKAHEISVGPYKDKAAGKRAKAVLEKATPRDREIAKNKYELSKPSRAEITESTNGEHNDVFDNFKNLTQALNWIKQNGNAFEKLLAARLTPFVAGYRFVVIDKPTDVPRNLQKYMDGAAGLHHEQSKTVYVMRRDGMNNTVILHEALHGATVAKYNQYLRLKAAGELDTNPRLEKVINDLTNVMVRAEKDYNAAKLTGTLSADMRGIPDVAFSDVKEFIAYGLSMPAMQKFLLSAEGKQEGESNFLFLSNLFTKFVQSIRSLFDMDDTHQSAFQDLILTTEQLLKTKVDIPTSTSEDSAEAARVEKVDKDVLKMQISNSPNEVIGAVDGTITEGHTWTKWLQAEFDARLPAMENGAIKQLLSKLQTSDIIKWKSDALPGLKQIDDLTQAMGAMRARGLAASANLANKLEKFIIKNGGAVLGDTMHIARLKKVGIDTFYDSSGNLKPLDQVIKDDYIVKGYEKKIAAPNTTTESMRSYEGKITTRSKNLKIVYDAWAKLGKQKDGHEMYRAVRQFYKDNQTVVRKILDDQIAALPIDDAAKAKLLKSARLMREQSKEAAIDLEDADKLTEVAFKPMEEDYFPLMRHGQYWLSVAKGPTGREFFMFDNGVDRNKYLNKRAKELGLSPDDSNFKSGDDITSLRQNFQGQSQMLQKMFADIDAMSPKLAAESAAAFKEELKDQLYQTYLMTLPERSFRKQFLHAEKVTGFSADILRNFKVSATKFANQTSKLKYGVQIENAISQTRDSLEGSPALDMAKLGLFIDEVAIRAREEINPPEQGGVATAINRFAFLMLLTSAASAATQMSSVPVMVVPTLNARYGYGATASKLAKYSQIWKTMGVTKTETNGETTFTAPSIGSSKMVKGNKILEDAFRAATENYNIFQLTNTSVLTDNKKTPASASTNKAYVAVRNGFNMLTGLFSSAERISREISFMMTFELEYAKTKNFDASVQKAVEITNDLLGRYDNMNRPRILRNTLGRTVGQFKMYAVYMTSWFVRNAYEIIRLSTPKAERVEAMHRLTGVLAMGGMFHGLVGMPLYSTICFAIDMVLDQFGDEDEKRYRRRRNPLTADNSNLRFRYEWLPQNFGHIEITGLDGREHRLSDVLEKGAISALTDVNIGSRTSFDNMWWRAPRTGRNFVETTQNFIIDNMGPGVSTGVNMVGAFDDFGNGKIERGLEKLVPALFRGSLVAGRLASEGAETKSGAVILKPSEISDLNLIAQVLGFAPTRLARIQEKNFEVQKEITEATTERTKLLKRLDETIYDSSRDPEKVKNILIQIRQHNQRYPAKGLVIESDTIERSIKSYGQRRAMTIRGQAMSKDLAPYIMPSSRAAAPLE